MSRATRPSLALLAEEPFRIFFPLGLLIGGVGVSLWPLYYAGAINVYPALPHARLMIEGLMSCFIFGFLGTAGPRVMSVPHFRSSEVLRLIVAICAAIGLHLMSRHALGDSLFLIALLFFAISLARRFLARNDSPPPNFALVGFGLLNGITGAVMITFSEWTNSAPNVFRLGSSFLNIGFVLLPLLGVAPFFIRRLLDLPGEPHAEQHLHRKALIAIALGLLIDLSLVSELFFPNVTLNWIRCAVVAIYLSTAMPLRGRSSLATALRMSLVALPAGLGLLAFLPAYRISSLHVLFIGSFSLAVLSVATRVVLGHSGRLDLLRRQRWIMPVVVILLILAMISRFSADFVATRNEHLIGGAIAWLLAAFLWGACVLPHVARIEEE